MTSIANSDPAYNIFVRTLVMGLLVFMTGFLLINIKVAHQLSGVAIGVLCAAACLFYLQRALIHHVNITFFSYLIPVSLYASLHGHPKIMEADVAWLVNAVGFLGLASLINLAAFKSTIIREGYSASKELRKLKLSEETSGSNDVQDVKHRAVHTRLNFGDVSGMSDLVNVLSAHGERIAQEGDVNGILLFGEPGNGKTFFANCLAGHLGLPIVHLRFGSVASRWVNETTENVIEVFRDARLQAPCVLFLDEVDSILTSRDSTQSKSEESDRIVNSVLTELVDLRGSGVVIVAATNYLDRLDGAAIREGRFDFKVEVPAPDYDARMNLIRQALNQSRSEIMISSDVLDRVSLRWEGFSVARIRHVMNEVVREANQARVDRVDTKFMYEVLRRVQGRAGRIAESIPMLDALILSQQQRGVLNKIASRLIKIDEIESMGGSVPRGVLFWGPPGTGKTFTAQVLAKTAGWAFLSVSGHDLMSDGDKLDKLLREASDIRPCVVFIDEADDVFGHRGGNAALTALTNKLLAAMDGTKGRIPDVLFIAATNHPDRFDPAALRGGRFTEKVEFANPGLPEIREFVQKWLNSLVIPRQSDVTPESVAELLVGRSNSDVKEVLQMALNEAVTRRVDMPTTQLMLRDVQVAADSV